MKLGFCSAKETARGPLQKMVRLSGCTNSAQNTRCYKSKHRGVCGHGECCSWVTRKQKEGTFRFPVPCPQCASSHARRPLCCSSLVLLNFLPLKCLLCQERRTPSPEGQWGSEDVGLQRAAQLSPQGRQLVATSCLTLQEGGTQEKDVRVATTVDGSCFPLGTARPPGVDSFIPER